MEVYEANDKVFVYGTLKKGFGNHRLLKDAEFICEDMTKPLYTMYSLGGFPAIQQGGDTSIIGEVYKIDKDTLAHLDVLEGYKAGRDCNMYERRITVTKQGHKCFIYEMDEPYSKELVENGEWTKGVY